MSISMWQTSLLAFVVMAWGTWEDEMEEVDFLQRHLAIETAEERRAKASPMFFLHIPKCGTSFWNAILHMPNSCPGLGNSSVDDEKFGSCFELELRKRCPELCDETLVDCSWPPEKYAGPHVFLTADTYETQKDHILAMFRQPEQRLLSQWYDNHTWNPSGQHASCKVLEDSEPFFTLEEFKYVFGGSATKQIVGWSNATLADVPQALQRMREGFAFVGLQEEWDLSICLFHAKFGGPCRQVEFSDTRPTDTSSSSSSTYDVSILNGWVDVVDAPVYAEARRLFYDDLEKYGVSPESCQTCYLQAGLTA